MATWVDFTLDDPIVTWASDTQASLQQGLQDTAPIGQGSDDRDAGTFRDSIEAYIANGGREIDGEGDAIPGTFLLTGTEAHEIAGNPFLSFDWPRMNRHMIVRRVQHPGTQPSDFADRTIDAHAEEWSSTLLDAIAQAWATGG